MTAKTLFINADDFGVAPDINKGIVVCYTRGAVTGISLLAVGEAFSDAVSRAKEKHIKRLGVHLAMTGPFKSAVSGKKFSGNYGAFFAKYFTGGIKQDSIYNEFKKQIEKIKKEGFTVTHIDSHQHIHMVPGILKIVIQLAAEEKIQHIRFPLEKVKDSSKLFNPVTFMRNLLLSSMCRSSHGLLDAFRIKHSDHFIGHIFAHKLKAKDLMAAVSGLENGLTEISCHPGFFTDDVRARHPQYKYCEEELRALCDKDFIDEIKRNNIELVSY